MVDVARDTQHYLELASATNDGEARDTQHYLESAESSNPLVARITQFYLEAAYSVGPPPTDRVRDTQHYLEFAFFPIYPHVNVECPFATSYIPGVLRQQTVCE